MLRDLIQMSMGMYAIALANEKKMCAEFAERAGKARQKYWDACKYPRKTKKRMRKEATTDYLLYSRLSEPILFSY